MDLADCDSDSDSDCEYCTFGMVSMEPFIYRMHRYAFKEQGPIKIQWSLPTR
jgi:hypothetical protein